LIIAVLSTLLGLGGLLVSILAATGQFNTGTTVTVNTTSGVVVIEAEDVATAPPWPPSLSPDPSPLAPGYHRVFEQRLQNSTRLIDWPDMPASQCATNCDSHEDCTYFEFQPASNGTAVTCVLWSGACTPEVDTRYTSNVNKWYYWRGCQVFKE
jgi:hypothetical protein